MSTRDVRVFNTLRGIRVVESLGHSGWLSGEAAGEVQCEARLRLSGNSGVSDANTKSTSPQSLELSIVATVKGEKCGFYFW